MDKIALNQNELITMCCACKTKSAPSSSTIFYHHTGKVGNVYYVVLGVKIV